MKKFLIKSLAWVAIVFFIILYPVYRLTRPLVVYLRKRHLMKKYPALFTKFEGTVEDFSSKGKPITYPVTIESLHNIYNKVKSLSETEQEEYFKTDEFKNPVKLLLCPYHLHAKFENNHSSDIPHEVKETQWYNFTQFPNIEKSKTFIYLLKKAEAKYRLIDIKTSTIIDCNY